MQKDTIATSAEQNIDEELVDSLIAISIVAKRLAKKLATKESDVKNVKSEDSKCIRTMD